MRAALAVADWLLCIMFWIGFGIALPGSAIAHVSHYLGLQVARRRGFLS